MTRRRPLVAVLTALTLAPLAALPLAAAAQAWPSKPVRLLVPLPPAATTDHPARPPAALTRRAPGRPLLVLSQPGRGGQ